MIVFLGIALSLVLIVVVIAMLLTRRLREKYAALWLVIGVGVLVFLGLLVLITWRLSSAYWRSVH